MGPLPALWKHHDRPIITDDKIDCMDDTDVQGPPTLGNVTTAIPNGIYLGLQKHFHVPSVDFLLHTVSGIIGAVKVDNWSILIVTTCQMQPWKRFNFVNNVPNGSRPMRNMY